MAKLVRFGDKPIITGRPNVWWDSLYCYNPGATICDGKVYLLYRGEGDER